MSELPALDGQVRITVRWWPWTLLLALAYLVGCGIALALGGDLHQQRVLASSATLGLLLITMGLAVARVDLELGRGERTPKGPFGGFLWHVLSDLCLALAPAVLALPAQAIALVALERIHPLAVVCVAIAVPVGLLLPACVGMLARILEARVWLAGLLGFVVMLGLALLPFCCCLPMFNTPVAVYYMVDTYGDVKQGPERVLFAALLGIPMQLAWTAPFLGASAWVYTSLGRRAQWLSSRANLDRGTDPDHGQT